MQQINTDKLSDTSFGISQRQDHRPSAVQPIVILPDDPSLDSFCNQLARYELQAVRIRSLADCYGEIMKHAELSNIVSGRVSRTEPIDLILCQHSHADYERLSAEFKKQGRHEPPLSFVEQILAKRTAIEKHARKVRQQLLNDLVSLAYIPEVRLKSTIGILRLHAWFYSVETGVVTKYYPKVGWEPVNLDNAQSISGDVCSI